MTNLTTNRDRVSNNKLVSNISETGINNIEQHTYMYNEKRIVNAHAPIRSLLVTH